MSLQLALSCVVWSCVLRPDCPESPDRRVSFGPSVLIVETTLLCGNYFLYGNYFILWKVLKKKLGGDLLFRALVHSTIGDEGLDF